MKTTVIYHSADYDGIFCREIAKKFLPDATLIGWNFGDPLIDFPNEGNVYVLDLSPSVFNKETKLIDNTRLIWIDHHISAIREWSAQINGYRIDGVAACRLAWQWFRHWVPDLYDGKGGINTYWERPTKQDFIDRKVNEPISVQLAGEYDIWDKRNPWAETLQYSLRAVEPDWGKLLLPPEDPESDAYTLDLVNKGEACQKYAQNVDASVCKHKTWLMEWEGLKFLCINSARFNSLVFAAKDVPETGHDSLMGFCFDGKGWNVSLYHAKHRTDIDLSVIAKKYNGGGHRGACGFTCKQLPFTL
jgi:uncharacterized protein